MLIKRLAVTATVATATVAGIMFTSGSPAYASTIGANNAGVAAAADFSWIGKQTIGGTVMYVRDIACDNNDVYAKLTLYSSSGSTVSTGTWINSGGCGTRRIINIGTVGVSGGYLTGARIIACVNDLPPDTCTPSGFLDNPNT